jgi:hypothetical protein
VSTDGCERVDACGRQVAPGACHAAPQVSVFVHLY